MLRSDQTRFVRRFKLDVCAFDASHFALDANLKRVKLALDTGWDKPLFSVAGLFVQWRMKLRERRQNIT